MMNPVSVHSARQIAETAGADRVMVIYLAKDGEYGVTTWGRTRALCRHMAKLSEGRLADLMLDAIGSVDTGVKLSALEPKTEPGEGVGRDVFCTERKKA